MPKPNGFEQQSFYYTSWFLHGWHLGRTCLGDSSAFHGVDSGHWVTFRWQRGWLVRRVLDGFARIPGTLTGGRTGSPWTVNQSAYTWPFWHDDHTACGLLTWRPGPPQQAFQGNGVGVARPLCLSFASPTGTSATFRWSVESLPMSRFEWRELGPTSQLEEQKRICNIFYLP